MDLLVVGHIHRAHDACHLGAERSKIAANVSIISNLFDFATFPRIPVTRDGDQDRQSEHYDEKRSRVLFQPGTVVRRGGSFVALRRRRFRHGSGDSAGTGEADIKFAPSSARKLGTLRYSWLCARGSSDVSCTSIIMLIRRSSCKKVAAFFPGKTFRKIPANC